MLYGPLPKEQTIASNCWRLGFAMGARFGLYPMNRAGRLGPFQNTCGARGARGVVEGPVGVQDPPFFQNSCRIKPMMVQPTTEFTPSISISIGLRIPNV